MNSFTFVYVDDVLLFTSDHREPIDKALNYNCKTSLLEKYIQNTTFATTSGGDFSDTYNVSETSIGYPSTFTFAIALAYETLSAKRALKAQNNMAWPSETTLVNAVTAPTK